MPLRIYLTCITFALLLFGCSLLRLVNAAEDRPNILFLFTDDQQADTLGALGNGVIKTPNLDRLVSSGTTFDRVYMQGGFNPATCVPSRAMLMSGRPLFQIDERLADDSTWPAQFGRGGYTTFATGKWHNGEASLIASFQRAKRIFSGGMTNPLRAPLSDQVDGKLTQPLVSQQHACEAFADAAIEFLTESHTNPFLCYVAFDGPHDPHIVPDDFPIQYNAESIPLPPSFLPEHPWDNGEMNIRDENLLSRPRDPVATKRMIANYYRYVSYIDFQIGRILDALSKSPAACNTIIVFASDSGVALGRHGLVGKQNLYEHSLRVPLILAGPGIPEGKRSRSLMYTYDIFPTLGQLCQVSGPRTSKGIDFSPVLSDLDLELRSELFFAYKSVQRAYRDEQWKLIHYPAVDRIQLFDLTTDPDEINNLADQPAMADRIAQFKQKIEQGISELQLGDTNRRSNRPPPHQRQGVRPPPPRRRP